MSNHDLPPNPEAGSGQYGEVDLPPVTAANLAVLNAVCLGVVPHEGLTPDIRACLGGVTIRELRESGAGYAIWPLEITYLTETGRIAALDTMQEPHPPIGSYSRITADFVISVKDASASIQVLRRQTLRKRWLTTKAGASRPQPQSHEIHPQRLTVVARGLVQTITTERGKLFEPVPKSGIFVTPDDQPIFDAISAFNQLHAEQGDAPDETLPKL